MYGASYPLFPRRVLTTCDMLYCISLTVVLFFGFFFLRFPSLFSSLHSAVLSSTLSLFFFFLVVSSPFNTDKQIFSSNSFTRCMNFLFSFFSFSHFSFRFIEHFQFALTNDRCIMPERTVSWLGIYFYTIYHCGRCEHVDKRKE